jgi:hypothetical protein
MPKLARYILAWSPLHQAYELYERQGNEALDIVPASLVWLVWVSQVSSSAFHGQNGSCTARKERWPRGEEAYWFAYARVGADDQEHVVLDNYQFIMTESIHHTLSFLLEHLALDAPFPGDTLSVRL